MEFIDVLDVERYSVVQLKKLFNECGSNVNFFNEFTMQDVEDGKKRLFFKLGQRFNSSHKSIQMFLDDASMKIIHDKFGDHNLTTNGNILGIRNTNRDTNGINQTIVKESERIIVIDSTYRDNISPYDSYNTLSTNMSLNLSDKLEKVTSMHLSNISIPFSFYNIDSNNGTNYFYIELVNSSEIIKIEIDPGNYTASSLITAINDAINDSSLSASENAFTFNSTTNKVTITNNFSQEINVIFYDYLDETTNFSEMPSSSSASSNVTNYSKVNYNLGWILGFRTINETNMEMTYNLGNGSSTVSESICYIPYTKYIIVTLDDMNKNQTNKSLVQIDNEKMFIKKPVYFSNLDNSLNCITEDNFDSYVNMNFERNGDKFTRTQLTKAQLYTALSINNYRSNYNTKNSKIDTANINNVIAVIPFESKSLIWGQSLFMSDKNRFARKYFGPVDITKMKIGLYDDKGNILNLNGQEWSMTLKTKHQYQY